ncbi:hypothetical protein N6L26_05875 [Qipengyuania sp. SS22]|uniref:lipopolysaccharide biosynthesis protein n=1 Tax=Qipengyuania sp. SS22 TaxID=2979461 RepID=UPI0021E5D298|nr:hypothetical protein [Qipengyuania sp. SS22]UYH56079.1 hypothetical protein N6L26_05875 [Qipengyuania sp. SS22]
MKLKLSYVWALADQVVYGLSASLNFIVLESLMPRKEYALLAVIYTFVVLYQMVSNAMFMDAFAVNLPETGREHFRRYFLYVVSLFLRLSVILGAVGSLGYLIICSASAQNIEICLILIFVFVSFAMLMMAKRLCYSIDRVSIALVGSVVYVVSYAAAVVAAYFSDAITIDFILTSLGAASLAGSLAILFFLKVLHEALRPTTAALDRQELWVFHRTFATQGLVAGSLKWVPDNALYSLLGVWGTLDQVASYRMASNLLMPFRYLIVTLVNLLLPKFAVSSYRGEAHESWKFIWLLILAFTGLSIGLFGSFWFFGQEIIGFLYSSDPEPVFYSLLVLSIIPALSAAQALTVAFLKAIKRMNDVIVQSLIGAVMTIYPGYFLMSAYGATGAAITLVLSISSMAIYSALKASRLKSLDISH